MLRTRFVTDRWLTYRWTDTSSGHRTSTPLLGRHGWHTDGRTLQAGTEHLHHYKGDTADIPTDGHFKRAQYIYTITRKTRLTYRWTDTSSGHRTSTPLQGRHGWHTDGRTLKADTEHLHHYNGGIHTFNQIRTYFGQPSYLCMEWRYRVHVTNSKYWIQRYLRNMEPIKGEYTLVFY